MSKQPFKWTLPFEKRATEQKTCSTAAQQPETQGNMRLTALETPQTELSVLIYIEPVPKKQAKILQRNSTVYFNLLFYLFFQIKGSYYSYYSHLYTII